MGSILKTNSTMAIRASAGGVPARCPRSLFSSVLNQRNGARKTKERKTYSKLGNHIRKWTGLGSNDLLEAVKDRSRWGRLVPVHSKAPPLPPRLRDRLRCRWRYQIQIVGHQATVHFPFLDHIMNHSLLSTYSDVDYSFKTFAIWITTWQPFPTLQLWSTM